ncbi:MAG: hypothetical protein NWQ54_09135 [Paraglaciecola sp.]|nr:hypothetical protein [Paraglaciecola sp.]
MSNKVLFLHKCFVKGGGVERVHQNLSAALQQQNIHTCFFVLHGYGESEAVTVAYKILSKRKGLM